MPSVETLAALLTAAAAAVGRPELAPLAPALAAALRQLLERHEAGEPLPEILRAHLGDDAALVAALISRDLGETPGKSAP